MTSVLKADASNELLNCDEPISSLFARPVSAVMSILVLFQLPCLLQKVKCTSSEASLVSANIPVSRFARVSGLRV